jgi:hypothetical protein
MLLPTCFERLANCPRARRRSLGLVAAATLLTSSSARAQYDYEQAPIHYATAVVDEPVSRLADRLEEGNAQLERDARGDYLKSLLATLKVPESSQVLVFSKTSFQRDRISPQTPRALYFNDDVYVGWVPGSDLLEVTAFDAEIGPVFYTMDGRGPGTPSFLRQNHECTQCHASSLTRGAPGHIVRSVYPDASGLPNLRNGSFLTDHRSPLRERWGGWYVTGRHGAARHLGNQTFSEKTTVEEIDREPGANVTSLEKRFDTTRYLTPHSDIVALMVLEHQITVQNQIAQSVYQTRYAERDATAMNAALGRPEDYQSESTARRIQSAAEALVKSMLLQGEAKLDAKIEGTSGFAEEFAKRGPFDVQGRSLRKLDLERRLFTYPCSYLIYSDAMRRLPPLLQSAFYERLHEVLTAPTPESGYEHLSAADRTAIREILVETLPEYKRFENSVKE